MVLKNYGGSLAKHEWIVNFDDDEIPSNELVAFLKQWLKLDHPAKVLRVRRINYCHGVQHLGGLGKKTISVAYTLNLINGTTNLCTKRSSSTQMMFKNLPPIFTSLPIIPKHLSKRQRHIAKKEKAWSLRNRGNFGAH